MFWFAKRRKGAGESEQLHDTRVEVVVTNEANKNIAKEAKKASESLNKVLKANHFTIKIFRAAGGKTKAKGVH